MIQESNDKAIKEVLFEITRIIDELFKEEIQIEDIELIEELMNLYKIKCYCDHYVGYNCGCKKRSYLKERALKEIEKIKGGQNG